MRSPFVLVCQTEYCVQCSRVCPRSVGTRQALLQGWLLCVGFVCLANVPDLVYSLSIIIESLVDKKQVASVKEELKHELLHLNIQHVTLETEFE